MECAASSSGEFILEQRALQWMDVDVLGASCPAAANLGISLRIKPHRLEFGRTAAAMVFVQRIAVYSSECRVRGQKRISMSCTLAKASGL
jgi:hypothetical protein